MKSLKLLKWPGAVLGQLLPAVFASAQLVSPERPNLETDPSLRGSEFRNGADVL